MKFLLFKLSSVKDFSFALLGNLKTKNIFVKVTFNLVPRKKKEYLFFALKAKIEAGDEG